MHLINLPVCHRTKFNLWIASRTRYSSRKIFVGYPTPRLLLLISALLLLNKEWHNNANTMISPKCIHRILIVISLQVSMENEQWKQKTGLYRVNSNRGGSGCRNAERGLYRCESSSFLHETAIAASRLFRSQVRATEKSLKRLSAFKEQRTERLIRSNEILFYIESTR